MEAVECGAAVLGIVLAHHGLHVPLEELRERCGVSRDGAKASNILRAAGEYGLSGKGMQMDTSALARAQVPAILFWDFYHFVVFEGFGRRFGRPVAYINDPADGRRTVTPEDFDSSFTGVVLLLRPGRRFKSGGRKASGLLQLSARLRSVRWPLIVALLATLLNVVAGMARPGFLRAFIDSVLVPGGSSSGVAVPLLLAMTGAMVATMGLVAVQEAEVLRAHVSGATLSSGRFMRHLLRLPIPFFHQRNPADIAQRLDSNQTVAGMLATLSLAAVSSVVVLVGYSALLWSYEPNLALLGFSTVLANVLLVRAVTRVRATATEKLRVDEARLAGVSFSGLQLIETMKATGSEATHFRRWSGLYAKLLNGRRRVEVPVAALSALTPAVSLLGSALVLMSGALSVVSGALTVGALVALNSVLHEIEPPVTTLTGLGPQLQDLDADATKLRDVENADADRVFVGPRTDDARRLVGAVTVTDLSFGYSRLSVPVLRDLSFRVRPGEQVALVGGSGSGKSTVSKLLTGLYAPWTGVIALDDVPSDQIDRGVRAASVAFVDQEIHLFAGSVRDNVRLWDPSIGDDAVVAALRDAQIYDDIARRPGGLDSPVQQEGRNFSGGQRQRLEIARALARNPSVMVLDEATSALDAETEHAISTNLRRRGCSRIVIAHRLSTIRDSDEILVLDQGSVAERGTHDQLLARGGRYAQLASETFR
jgi:NHLM bacteriocin system ABC transporter peptidase/ATP-binding protein